MIIKHYLISSKVFWQIPNEKDDFVGRIKNWARQLVKETNVVIAIAPGHEKGPPSSNNFLHKNLNIQNMIFHGDLLVRTKEVKKSTDGGNRSQKEHEETIT